MDGSGASLIGSFARDSNTRAIQWANTMGNEAYNSLGQEMISFCVDPISAYSKGANSGYCIMTGTETLVMKTNASLTSASYQIDIRMYMYEQLVVHQGQLKSTRT